MHILLPPSEGKTAPNTGSSLHMESLGYPALTDARQKVANTLVDVSAREDAGAVLKVGARTMPEVRSQRHLFAAPCAPARSVYTGVLYEAAQLREGDHVLIFSGLFGVTCGDDMIPAYRLSMNVSLPGLGAMKSFWRKHLVDWEPDEKDAVAGSGDHGSDCAVTVDMRSQSYCVTKPKGEWWMVSVRNGQGKVISHMAKWYRGLLTRALLDSGSDDVAEVARTLGSVSVESSGNRRMLILVPDELR